MTEERKTIKGAGGAGWLLVASIALNCFLIGIIAAPMIKEDGVALPAREVADFGHRPRGGGPDFVFARVAQELTPDEAQKLRAIFKEERKTFRDKHSEMRDVMRRIADVIKAENPDMEALRKITSDVQLSGEALHKGMCRTFERMATELTPESRRKIAVALEGGEGPMQPPPPPPEMERDNAIEPLK